MPSIFDWIRGVTGSCPSQLPAKTCQSPQLSSAPDPHRSSLSSKAQCQSFGARACKQDATTNQQPKVSRVAVASPVRGETSVRPSDLPVQGSPRVSSGLTTAGRRSCRLASDQNKTTACPYRRHLGLFFFPLALVCSWLLVCLLGFFFAIRSFSSSLPFFFFPFSSIRRQGCPSFPASSTRLFHLIQVSSGRPLILLDRPSIYVIRQVRVRN